jgi:AraC-like DNA-binding protein
VPEHAHDWPLLSLFVMGSVLTRAEPGEAFMCGPSAILYRAGSAHRNTVGDVGFEQIEIEFDPAWLGEAIPAAPVSRWIGGRTGAAAGNLARLCVGEADEDVLRSAVRRFLDGANRAPSLQVAAWVGEVGRWLRENPRLQARDLANAARRHPAWLGAAFRQATGEGLAAAASRFRLERAARLLRETDLAPAQIAVEAGFCDQSHMSRTFRNLLSRVPSAVRADRDQFRA